MKLRYFWSFLIVILLFSSTNVNSVPTNSIYESKLYEHPNNLVIKESNITFYNYGPKTLEEETDHNGANIEWKIVGAKFIELKHNFELISNILNTTFNLRSNNSLNFTTVYRGENFKYSITDFFIKYQNNWSWDYWEISKLAYERIFKEDIDKREESYLKNYDSSDFDISGLFRVLDKVILQTNHSLLSEIHSNFMDHDIFTFTVKIFQPEAFLIPIFRTPSHFENSYKHIYVSGKKYSNNSRIPLHTINDDTLAPVVNLQGEIIPNEVPEPTVFHNSIPSQISYLNIIIISSAYYKLLYQKKQLNLPKILSKLNNNLK